MNEKDKHRLYEMLSAYLDGESDAPAEIERLIESDADAARLYTELSRLSTSLKSLPAPEVHPAFATRVMAHVREARDAGSAVPAWRQVVVKLLGAAAAVALIAIAVWPFWPGKGITEPTEKDPVLAEVLRLRNQPEQSLAAQFGPLIAEPYSAGASKGPLDIDSGLALVSDPAVAEDYAEVVGKVATLLRDDNGCDDDDVFVAIDSLSESQAEALRALLTDYDEGGNELL